MKIYYKTNAMNRQNAKLPIILFFLIGLLMFGSNNINAQSWITLHPTEDTYQRHSGGTTPFGSSETLLIQFHSDGAWRREAYLKFQISGITSSIESALLILYPVVGNAEISPTHTVRETTTNWNELTLVSANKPTIFDSVIDVKVYSPGEPATFDVTNLVKTRIEEEKDTISLHIRPSGVAGALNFHSKESSSTDLWPVLKIKDISTKVINYGEEKFDVKVSNRELSIIGESNVSIIIYDVTGKVVLSHKKVQSTQVINLSDLRSGIYIMGLEHETGRKTIKIML